MKRTSKILNRRHLISALVTAAALVLTLSTAALCQFLGPELFPAQPGDGSTLAGRIDRGDIVLLPYQGNTFWNNDAVFTSFAGLKVQSDNGYYNIVVGKDGNSNELADFVDKDFMFIGNAYSEFLLDSRYVFTFPRDPLNTHSYETTRYTYQPWRPLSRVYYNIPAGLYEDVGCHVFDFGEIPSGYSGSVCDGPNGPASIAGGFDYDLYIVSFTEQDRVLPCNNTAVPISLTTVPSSLPNMSNLSVTVEWEGLYSDLYTDSSCQSMITGTGNKYTWSLSSAPSVIYFKKASNDMSAKQYRIRLEASVGNDTSVITVKRLQAQGSFVVKQVDGGSNAYPTSDLQGYWTGSLADYSPVEWMDDPSSPNGEAVDAPGTSSTEYNRPLLYRIGNNDAFKIHSVAIKHGDGITYSSADYWLRATSDDGLLNANANSFSDSGSVITGGAFIGSVFTSIQCKDVYISWELINKTTGSAIKIGETKHKLYVIRGSAANPFHTLVDFGCSAANGLSSEQDVIGAIWDKLMNLTVIREDGGTAFKYWGPEASIDIPDPFYKWYNHYDGVIAHRDGRCGGWADFVNELYAVMGISSVAILVIADNYEGYNDQNEYVKICNGTVCDTDIVVSIGQTADNYQGGTPGGSAFNLHYINEVNGYYCDASCGSAMCSTKTEFARKYLKIVYYVSGVEKT